MFYNEKKFEPHKARDNETPDNKDEKPAMYNTSQLTRSMSVSWSYFENKVIKMNIVSKMKLYPHLTHIQTCY